MNGTSVAHSLLTTPALAVHDVACCGQPANHGVLLGGDAPRLVLVRRGAFIVQRDDREHVADPCSAIVLWDRVDYRVRHPGPGGDDCVVIALDHRVAGRLLGGLRRDRDVALPLGPQLQVAVAAFGTAARRAATPATTEQAALGLLAAIVANADQRPVAQGPTRQLATAAIGLIHRDLATNHEIAEVADELGCSTFHLMHAFRAELGQTLRAYRVRARLGVALHRLADGEDDLATLAVELGFASHSHLTDTFVRALGAPPSQLRAYLRGA
ncbi:MAG: AraC family transcriptional regulator [Kofleriaceae bacterium]